MTNEEIRELVRDYHPAMMDAGGDPERMTRALESFARAAARKTRNRAENILHDAYRQVTELLSE